MARAKRTDRTEARRRHRVVTTQSAASESDGEAQDAGRPSSAEASATQRPTRPSFFGAFRAAARPIHLREDVEALPAIARHSKALWVPALIVLVSGALVGALGVGRNALVDLLFQTALVTPAMVPAFLAGMLAPRAGYLTGGLIGLLSAIVSSILVAAGLSGPESNGATGPLIPANQLAAYVAYAVGVGTLFSAGVGGFSAYYRRFLALSNPNAGRSRPRSTKPAPRRR